LLRKKLRRIKTKKSPRLKGLAKKQLKARFLVFGLTGQ
jgi:hypothetical protein